MGSINCDYIKYKNREDIEHLSELSYLSENNLSVSTISDGIVVPKYTEYCVPGLYRDDYSYIEESYLHSNVYGSDINIDIHEKKVILENSSVVFIGTFLNCWGHCITDNIKHLWFILYPEHNWLRNLDFVYVTLDNKDLTPNFLSILNKLGITNIRRINQITQFNKVYLPDQCFFCRKEIVGNNTFLCRYYTKEYSDLIERIKDGIEPNPGYEKVYYSRLGFKNKKDTGEERIVPIFQQLGYKIVSPEQYSLEEQIAILKGCKSFAATQGSVSLNAVFLNRGTEFILLKKHDILSGYQLAIIGVSSLNAILFDAHKSVCTSKEAPWEGPFFICLTKELANWAHVAVPVFPFCEFALYISRGIVTRIRESKLFRRIQYSRFFTKLKK